MVNRIADSSFFQENQIAGVHIEILSEKDYSCNFVVVEKKKGHLHTILKDTCSIEQLTENLSPSIPLYLSIDGKGILQRELKQINLSDNELISQAFPNIEMSEFYVQQTILSDNKTLAFFARKFPVNNIITQLKETGFSVIHLFLGCLSIETIANIVKSSNLNAYPYNIVIEEHAIISIERTNDNNVSFSQIGEERIECQYVISFANALTYFINKEAAGISTDLINEDKNKLSYLRIIKKGGVVFLMTIFVILLINFILFRIQSDKQKTLSAELDQYQSTIQQLDKIKEEISEKERIMQNGSWGGNSYFAYYADRIAASKPNGIVLEKMEIFPVKLKNKKFDINGIQKDTIQILGNTRNSLLLNDWTKVLSKQKFVRHVNISNYTQEEASSGKFILELAVQPKIK